MKEADPTVLRPTASNNSGNKILSYEKLLIIFSNPTKGNSYENKKNPVVREEVKKESLHVFK